MAYTNEYSYKISKKQYDYLLPIYGITTTNQLLHKQYPAPIGDRYYFIGTPEEYKELLVRCAYID